MNIVHCAVCQKMPHEIEEYVQLAELNECTPTEVVVDEEGTYNRSSGRFYCTPCYIRIGQPLGKAP